MTAFPSDRRPKAQRHATNEPSLPPQRQNLWDIWLGNTQSEFRASPLCLFSSVNISLPLCKKTNYSPPFYCLFKLAWPPRSRPQSIPSSVRARGLKAHLVHSFTSQSVCVFVSPPSLKGGGGGAHTIWHFWWVSGGTVHVFCDAGGEGGRGGVLESTPKMTRAQRGQQSHVLSDCQKNRHQLFSPLALEKGVSVRTHGEVGLNGRQQRIRQNSGPRGLWRFPPCTGGGWVGGCDWWSLKKTKAHEVVRCKKITVMT